VRNENTDNRSSMTFAQVAQKDFGGYNFVDLSFASESDFDSSNDCHFKNRTVKVGVNRT